MVTVEDLKDYFFVVTMPFNVCVQAEHTDGRKFSYIKRFDNEKDMNPIEEAKAITLCELIEEINKEEEL